MPKTVFGCGLDYDFGPTPVIWPAIIIKIMKPIQKLYRKQTLMENSI